ncbi:muramidase (phage lysozyme) [Archangium gephyra]|uniref:Muramidase (Phage lysozyme) n=1 Tax=Archangium gephyra TaxID=48 RepID=A0AAC8Q5M6_9BACT|nr:hypothetical protein [Archangium gephyra]AKJ01518.1 Phage lysin, 1,4-beta-N-acetylmuramidase [Archangium gephyra]REG34334.1 muramidase (phage lysozyme) [Archangium gephyra]
MSNENAIVGLNIRKEANGRSAKLGLLPRGARIELGEHSPDGKWGRIKKVLSGEIAPVTKGGRVDPGASTGWVFLGELDAEPAEPEAFDSIVVPAKPRPIKAGELIGHVGEYQQYDDAQPVVKRGWRSLLHVEVFSGDNVPAFIGLSRNHAKTLPEGSGSLFVIESGARLVYPDKADTNLAPGEHVTLLDGSSKAGHWLKVSRVSAQVMERSKLGTFNKATNSYAKGGTWTGWFVGARADQRTRDEAEATRKGYTRREVLVPTGKPFWVERKAWSGGTQPAQLTQALPAWSAFPLQLKNTKAPDVSLTRVVSRAELERVPPQDRAVDPEGTHWWRLNVRITSNDPTHSMATEGWVCEKGLQKVSWQSPWAWPGFDFVEEGDVQPIDMWSSLQHRTGMAEPGEGVDFKARADKVDKSALVKKIYENIDQNKDGRLDAQELRQAIKQPLLAQSLSRLIARYESEWGGDMAKWNALDPLMIDGKPEWAAEKLRIDSLRWWPQMAAKLKGFPASPLAFHIHPIALVANFIGGTSTNLSEAEARVRAFLRMIRVGEGTEGVAGYARLFGGSSFIQDHGKTFADHPRILIKKGYNSSAAGAYQVMQYTWDDPGQVALRKKYGIKDFSPKSQDRYGVILIKHKRNALEEVKNNKIKEAIQKCNTEWASLPGSPYGQPTVNWDRAISEYNGYLEQELKGKSDLAIGKGDIDDLL